MFLVARLCRTAVSTVNTNSPARLYALVPSAGSKRTTLMCVVTDFMKIPIANAALALSRGSAKVLRRSA